MAGWSWGGGGGGGETVQGLNAVPDLFFMRMEELWWVVVRVCVRACVRVRAWVFVCVCVWLLLAVWVGLIQARPNWEGVGKSPPHCFSKDSQTLNKWSSLSEQRLTKLTWWKPHKKHKGTGNRRPKLWIIQAYISRRMYTTIQLGKLQLNAEFSIVTLLNLKICTYKNDQLNAQIYTNTF